MLTIWNGIYFKLGEAGFYRMKMSQVLVPASASSNSHAHYMTNTIQEHRWAPDFYYYFDAFLAAARSVDFVIQATFGMDNVLTSWTKSLSTTEQNNRKKFSSTYEKDLVKDFQCHLLSHVRRLTIHRSGLPSVEVTLTGRWGMTYSGSPSHAIPTTEQRTPILPDDPMLPVGWMQSPDFPLKPCEEDFSIAENLKDNSTKNYKLFPACDEYLQLAQRLVEEAKVLANEVYKSEPTPPPLYKL